MKKWEEIKLGDLCEVITKGTTPTSIGHRFTDSGINFIKVESLTESGEIIPNKVAYIDEVCHQALKRSQLKKNDILFSIAGALGRIGIVKEDILPANTNQALAIIRLKKESNVLVEFIAKYFISNIVTDEIEKLRIGAAQQNLSLTQLNNLFVPIPPLPEQQRIVSILDECFAAIDQAKANAEQNLKNAKELFESQLQWTMDNGKLKMGWEEKKLGDVCETGAGGTPLKSHKDYYEGGTIPWLLSGEVSKGEIFEAKNFITEKGLKNSSAKLFPINTVLIAMYGATAGQVGILRFSSCTNQAVCGILPNKDFIPEFLYYKFLAGKEALVSQAVGGAQPNISQIKIKNTLIPVIPLKEQQTIVRQLDALRAETQKLEAVYQKKIADLEELKKSILQKAFAGELRSPEGAASANDGYSPSKKNKVSPEGAAYTNDGYSPSDKKKKTITSPERT